MLNQELTKSSVAVGMSVARHPPHRSVRARLAHTAPTLGSGGKPLQRVRMKNAWLWNPAVKQRVEPLPVRAAALTAATDYERPHLTQPKRRSNGTFIVWRKTAKKRMTAKLRDIKAELRRRMHEPIALVGEWLKKVVAGYFQYHAIPGNLDRLSVFRHSLSMAFRISKSREHLHHHSSGCSRGVDSLGQAANPALASTRGP